MVMVIVILARLPHMCRRIEGIEISLSPLHVGLSRIALISCRAACFIVIVQVMTYNSGLFIAVLIGGENLCYLRGNSRGPDRKSIRSTPLSWVRALRIH